MINFRKFFHLISYLQYPLMLISIYFIIIGNIEIKELDPQLLESKMIIFGYLNKSLIFLGLGISFSTMQDTTKSQNNFSLKIWRSKTKGKIFLIAMSSLTIFILAWGIWGMLSAKNPLLEEIAMGFVVLGIGLISFVKTGFEFYEYHSRNPV